MRHKVHQPQPHEGFKQEKTEQKRNAAKHSICPVQKKSYQSTADLVSNQVKELATEAELHDDVVACSILVGVIARQGTGVHANLVHNGDLLND